MSTDQINTATLASIGSTDLPAGATKTLDYTFTKAYPAVRWSLPATCRTIMSLGCTWPSSSNLTHAVQ